MLRHLWLFYFCDREFFRGFHFLISRWLLNLLPKLLDLLKLPIIRKFGKFGFLQFSLAQLRIYDFYKKVLRLLITLNKTSVKICFEFWQTFRLLITLNKTSVKIQNKSCFFLAEYLILGLFAVYLEPPVFFASTTPKGKIRYFNTPYQYILFNIVITFLFR